MITPIGRTQYARAYPIGQSDDDEDVIGIPTVAPPPATMPESAPIGTTASAAPAPVVKSAPIGNPQLDADQKRLGYLRRAGSGIDQITKPVDAEGNPTGQHVGIGKKILGGLARVGDVALGSMFPGVAQFVPGTTLHHQVLLNGAERNVGSDLNVIGKEAQSNEQNARAQALLNPPDKDPNLQHVVLDDGTGKPQFGFFNPKSGQFFDQTGKILNGAKPYEKPDKEPVEKPESFQHVAGLSHGETVMANYSPTKGKYFDTNGNEIKDFRPLPTYAEVAPTLRVVQALDPNNPGNTIYVTGQEAAERHMAGPQSIPFQTEKGVQRAFTSGKPAQTLNAFNTAIAHLSTLDRLAGDLGNSDTQVFNRAAQTWKEQTGNPAPVNFAAAVNAMSGEVAAALKASGATDQEISQVRATFSRAQSPSQLKGAINTYRELLQSKEQQLKGQYEQGRRGEPNFVEQNAKGQKVGDEKKFPNGKTGVWDGHGWVAQ